MRSSSGSRGDSTTRHRHLILALTGVTPAVRAVFRLTGVDDSLTILE